MFEFQIIYLPIIVSFYIYSILFGFFLCFSLYQHINITWICWNFSFYIWLILFNCFPKSIRLKFGLFILPVEIYQTQIHHIYILCALWHVICIQILTNMAKSVHTNKALKTWYQSFTAKHKRSNQFCWMNNLVLICSLFRSFKIVLIFRNFFNNNVISWERKKKKKKTTTNWMAYMCSYWLLVNKIGWELENQSNHRHSTDFVFKMNKINRSFQLKRQFHFEFNSKWRKKRDKLI